MRMLHSLDALEDDSTSLCEWLCHQPDVASGDELITPDTYRCQIEATTTSDFHTVAREALASDLRTTWVLGGIRFWKRWRLQRILRADEKN